MFVAYAPTEFADNNDKDTFYNREVSAAVSVVPPFNVLRLLEDTGLRKKYNQAQTNRFNSLLNFPEDVDD